MGWYSGSASAAGDFLTALNNHLVANHSTWSSYDSGFATNEEVFRCLDAPNNVEFYLYCRDNQSNYCHVELWEGWDTGSHAGTGASVTYGASSSYYPYISKKGDYYLSTHDHRFIWIDKTEWEANYIGELIRFDDSKSQPVLITSSTSYGTGRNPLGYYESSGYAVWRMLKDPWGNAGSKIEGYAGTASRPYPKTYTGSFWVCPLPFYHRATRDGTDLGYRPLVGIPRTVMRLYTTTGATNEWTNGDIITMGGDRWHVIGGTYSAKYWTLIKEE